MRAIDKFYEDAKYQANWMNVLTGQQYKTIDGTQEKGFYGVSIETFRKQLRQDGFYTKIDGSGDVLHISRKQFKYFN
jgi:hypothetical protein